MWCVHSANVSLACVSCSPECRPRAWHYPRAYCVWPSQCWPQWRRWRRCASSSACDDAWVKCRQPCCLRVPPRLWSLSVSALCGDVASGPVSTCRLSNCKSYLCALRIGCSTCSSSLACCSGCSGCGCGCGCTLGCIICVNTEFAVLCK